MKKILALYGRHDSGKTETLLTVIDKLRTIATEELYYEKGPNPKDDATAILVIDSIVIGLTSRGDIGYDLKKILDMFLDRGCVVIVCPTRKTQRPNGSVEIVKKFSTTHDYELIWIAKERTEDETLEGKLNEADAENVLRRVKEAIAPVLV